MCIVVMRKFAVMVLAGVLGEAFFAALKYAQLVLVLKPAEHVRATEK